MRKKYAIMGHAFIGGVHMLIHRVKVHSTSSHQISKEEYEKMCAFLSDFQTPLMKMPSYEMLCDKQSPFSMQRTAKSFELPLYRNLFGLYEVDVLLEGERCRFLIDTGAQISGVRKQKAEKLHLKHLNGVLEIGSVGSTKMKLNAVEADQLQLGAITWQHLPLVLLDQQRFSLPFLQMDLLRFDGILGWDLLSMLDFELDTIAKRFKVIENRFRFDYPNMVPCSFPTVLVREKNGGVALFGVDTGAKQSWLGDAYIQERSLRVISEAKVIGFGVHGKEEMMTPIVDRLELYVDRAQIQLHGCISAFVEVFEGHPFDGVFGNEIFAGRRIRFVNSKQMLLLT